MLSYVDSVVNIRSKTCSFHFVLVYIDFNTIRINSGYLEHNYFQVSKSEVQTTNDKQKQNKTKQENK